MSNNTCSIADCSYKNRENKIIRGFCPTHYAKAWKSGDLQKLPCGEASCNACGSQFLQRNSRHKFCSYECKESGRPGLSGAKCRVCQLPVSTKKTDGDAGTKAVHHNCLPLMPNGRRSEHGASGYSKGGCRCDVCTAGHAAEYRAWSRKWFEETGQWHGGRWIKEDERLALYERDGWICQICFEPVLRTAWSNDPKDATLDHIWPRSKGGSHDPENLRTACLLCNARRSDNTEDLVLP